MIPLQNIISIDGIVVGLTWSARDAIISSSKSSEMNVTFPIAEGPDADWIELPIPEQFVTKLTPANKLVTSVSELYTA